MTIGQLDLSRRVSEDVDVEVAFNLSGEKAEAKGAKGYVEQLKTGLK